MLCNDSPVLHLTGQDKNEDDCTEDTEPADAHNARMKLMRDSRDAHSELGKQAAAASALGSFCQVRRHLHKPFPHDSLLIPDSASQKPAAAVALNDWLSLLHATAILGLLFTITLSTLLAVELHSAGRTA